MGNFCVTQILGQNNPAVGLFIAGILHRLLERAVLSTIELKHFFGKYRFVYIYCIDKIVSVLYIVTFYAEQHTLKIMTLWYGKIYYINSCNLYIVKSSLSWNYNILSKNYTIYSCNNITEKKEYILLYIYKYYLMIYSHSTFT